MNLPPAHTPAFAWNKATIFQLVVFVLLVTASQWLYNYNVFHQPFLGSDDNGLGVDAFVDEEEERRLRFDWTNLEITSTFAKRMQQHQTNCSLPTANFRYRNRFGLGSDLHVWTQAVCNAMDEGYRVQTEIPWIYMAEQVCGEARSAMTCYFPKSELLCPEDEGVRVDWRIQNHKLFRGEGQISRLCQPLMEKYNMTFSDVRAAGIEFLFSHVSQFVQEEATRQFNQVFANVSKVPDNLITVHVRWGDKKNEMELVSIEGYVEAVKIIVSRRNTTNDTVNVFLACEDPEAVSAFLGAAPSEWNVFMDQYFHDFVAHRDPGYNGNPHMSAALEGEPGLKALGSLLVAMEANDFVLTTASNWSRLMNELRKNILESRCPGCTSMIDLRSGGEW